MSTPPSGGPLEYTVTSNAPWLTASPSSFVLSPGESRPVTLSVDRSGLEFGRYAAEITISFDGGTSGSSLVPVTIEMAGAAFPSEGRGLDTWALVLIGLGGAALLWIIVSQATLRLSGSGTGTVRQPGIGTPLGAGAQLDFGLESPVALPAGYTQPTAQSAIAAAAKGPQRVLEGLLRLSQMISQRVQQIFDRTPRGPMTMAPPMAPPVEPPVAPEMEPEVAATVMEEPVAPPVEVPAEPVVQPQATQPTEEPSERPATTVSQSIEPDVRTRARLPFTESNALTSLLNNITKMFAVVMPRLKGAKGTSAEIGAATGRVGRRALTSLLDNITKMFAVLMPRLKAAKGTSAEIGTATGRVGRRTLSGLASSTAWLNTARLIARIALEISKRMDISVLAYVISLPLTAFMVILMVLRIAGVGTFLGFIPGIIIAIIAGTVFVFTRIRRTRSGNIRRASSAADALDQDRA